MKITQSHLRRIIRKELVREMRNSRGLRRPDADEAYSLAYEDALEDPNVTPEQIADINGWDISDPTIESAILDGIDAAYAELESPEERWR